MAVGEVGSHGEWSVAFEHVNVFRFATAFRGIRTRVEPTEVDAKDKNGLSSVRGSNFGGDV